MGDKDKAKNRPWRTSRHLVGKNTYLTFSWWKSRDDPDNIQSVSIQTRKKGENDEWETIWSGSLYREGVIAAIGELIAGVPHMKPFEWKKKEEYKKKKDEDDE